VHLHRVCKLRGNAELLLDGRVVLGSIVLSLHLLCVAFVLTGLAGLSIVGMVLLGGRMTGLLQVILMVHLIVSMWMNWGTMIRQKLGRVVSS